MNPYLNTLNNFLGHSERLQEEETNVGIKWLALMLCIKKIMNSVLSRFWLS
jgi:hypothetical protein